MELNKHITRNNCNPFYFTTRNSWVVSPQPQSSLCKSHIYNNHESLLFSINGKKHINYFDKQCITCTKNKVPSPKYDLLPPSTNLYEPCEYFQIDLIGLWKITDSKGLDFLIKAVTMIDVGTRWPELQSSTEKGSSNISFIFDREWICRYPRPKMVIYDNGTEFSSEFHELLLSYGIIPKRTTIKNPQTNYFIERIHLVIANELRAMDLHLRPHDPKSNLAILQSVA